LKILIASDLHGNLEAMRVLPTDHDELWVLGDLVNYGPNPAEVIGFVREHASLVVRGNHDDAVGFGRDPECSAPYRQLAAETGLFTMAATTEGQREFLRTLPLTAERMVDGFRFFVCHATPGDPLHEYRDRDSDLWGADADRAGCDVLLAGHTHKPFCRVAGVRTVANPGSVGQSKEGSGRAYYAIWQNGDLRLDSVAYPVGETIAKVRSLPVSPEVRAQLENVLRTGSLTGLR
jgi:putative phosphoesterase